MLLQFGGEGKKKEVFADIEKHEDLSLKLLISSHDSSEFPKRLCDS